MRRPGNGHLSAPTAVASPTAARMPLPTALRRRPTSFVPNPAAPLPACNSASTRHSPPVRWTRFCAPLRLSSAPRMTSPFSVAGKRGRLGDHRGERLRLGECRFVVELIKPSHYDDDGYVIQ